MLFNFFLGNHHANALNSLGDLLQPIYEGLIEAGHDVIGFATGTRPAPAVNVLVEWFENDPFADELLRAKAEQGHAFVFGVLCTEDLADQLVMDPAKYPRRLANLRRILPVADFVWTLLPQEDLLRPFCAPGHVALVEYGFTEACVERNIVRTAARRDVDAVLYGNESPYRKRIVDGLKSRGLNCFVSYREVWPNFMMDDLIRRAKVLIDMRRGSNVRFLSPTRIVKGLHSGTAVVSESFDTSSISSLYAYTEACPYEAMVETCASLIASGIYVERGLAAQARFRAETSMRANMTRALSPPVFARLSGK
ncbi:MAG TPA: hypothetical protein VMH36_18485 [Alphaproteobacteria bacterium]|nr:hypothetical protein [Alphaproteobacteria bacterium]